MLYRLKTVMVQHTGEQTNGGHDKREAVNGFLKT